MNHPVFKGLLFAAIPFACYILGMLNYSQAGKNAILGFFILTMLFYWKEVFQNRKKTISALIALASMIILLFMSFQMATRDIFSVQQDDMVVIESIFNTNPSETKEFFMQYGRQILKYLILFVVVSFAFLYLTLKEKKQKSRQPGTGNRKQVVACCVFTVLAIVVHLNPTMRRANPLFYFPINYSEWKNDLIETKKLMKELESNIKLDSSSVKYDSTDTKRTLVWVIGESDTRNNWGLYGYKRQTTPNLSRHKELLAFNNIISADRATTGSLSKMLTPATMSEPDLWKKKPDILSIAKAAGYKVFWLSNHGSDKRGMYSVFTSHADKIVLTNMGTSRGESSLDKELFVPYSEALDDKAEKKLIIVHILGAHPAYNYRYPKEYSKFNISTDDAVTKELTDKGRSKIAIVFRNQYDNAILYQDFILSTLLEKLQEKKLPNSAWLYISDHGQDVSHNTDFSGHNYLAKEMWEVPMLFWSSKNFLEHSRIPPLSTPYQADVINHTILGLLDISGIYYDSSQDIFNAKPENN
jgi:heptose-I-phosphate ethanolaminephosphotransferase